MAKVEVKATLNDGSQITWDKRWIQNINTKVQETTDNTAIAYGICPSNGNVTLIDIDGSIKKEVDKGNISQKRIKIEINADGFNHVFYSNSAKYSVADNTLGLSLGSKLDEWGGYTYMGHDLSQTTAFDLLCDILSVVGYTRQDVEKATTDKVVISSIEMKSISEYLKNIVIKYPKLSATSVPTAVGYICNLCQLYCFEDENGMPKFSSGRKTIASLYDIVEIPLSSQYSTFEYDVFEKNKIKNTKIIGKVFTPTKAPSVIASFPVKVFDGEKLVATESTANPIYESGELSTSGTMNTNYMGIVTSTALEKTSQNAIPDSIESSITAKVTKFYGNGLSRESDITATSWNGRPETDFCSPRVGNDGTVKVSFNVFVHERTHGKLFTDANVDDFTINVYKKTYELKDSIFMSGSSIDEATELASPLFQPETKYGDSSVYRLASSALLEDYKNGCVGNGTLTISLNVAKSIKVGSLVVLPQDKNTWLVTGMTYRYAGCPWFDLELCRATPYASSAFCLFNNSGDTQTASLDLQYADKNGTMYYGVGELGTQEFSKGVKRYRSNEAIPVPNGQALQFYGNNFTHICSKDTKKSIFKTSNDAGFEVSGTLEALLNYNDTTKESATDYTFYSMLEKSGFSSVGLISDTVKMKASYMSSICDYCENLTQLYFEIKATALDRDCCNSAFANCSELEDARNVILPTKDLSQAYSCYCNMFKDCSKLKFSPELPAIVLADGCYTQMFMNCTSLTRAPKLPATELKQNCYILMFSGCHSLKISDSSGTLFFTCPNDIPNNAVRGMFIASGGVYTEDPVAGGKYYYSN